MLVAANLGGFVVAVVLAVVVVPNVVNVRFILGKLGFIELNLKLPVRASAGGNGGGGAVVVVVVVVVVCLTGVMIDTGLGGGAWVGKRGPGVVSTRTDAGELRKAREGGDGVCWMWEIGDCVLVLLGPPQFITHSSIVSKLFSLP